MPEYDPVTGEHAWMVCATFAVADPAAVDDGTRSMTLSGDSIRSLSPVFCYHCENAYTALLAEAPCDGEPVR
jgi:hypothetical protein